MRSPQNITFKFFPKDLADERQRILSELTERQNEAQKLSKEKENLSEVTEALKRNLKSIEEQTRKITVEKSATEQRWECQMSCVLWSSRKNLKGYLQGISNISPILPVVIMVGLN